MADTRGEVTETGLHYLRPLSPNPGTLNFRERVADDVERPTLPPLAELFPNIPLRRCVPAPLTRGHRSWPQENLHGDPQVHAGLFDPSSATRFSSPSSIDETISSQETRSTSPSDSVVTASTPSFTCDSPHGSDIGDSPSGVEFGLYRLGAHGLETLVTDNDRPIDRYRRPAPEDPRRPKKHSCPDCSFRDARLSVLKIHMRRHTGERPFKCEVCSRVYISTSNLYRHRRSCHSAAKGRKTAPTKQS